MAFERLTSYLYSLPSRGIPGGQLTVTKQHKVIYQDVFGTKNDGGDPTAADTLYYMYSASKVLTCASFLRLLEETGLSLDTPVKQILPEYERLTVLDGEEVRPARTVMTLAHLMTMCGGFSYDREHPVVKGFLQAHPNATARELSRAMADMPLLFDPGTHFSYSFCHDVLLGVLEEISGRRASDYIKEKMLLPLGIQDLYYHKEEIADAEARMATQYTMDTECRMTVTPKCAYIFTPSYDSGGAGCITSAAEYAKFADAMAMGGVGASGARILSEASVRTLYQNRLGEVQMEDYHRGPGNYGYGYGLGVRTLLSQSDRGNISRSHIGEFGWGGAAGAFFLADPESGVGISYTMHVLNYQFHGTYNEHPHNMIRDLVFEELEG